VFAHVPKGIPFRRKGNFETQTRSTDIIAEQPISRSANQPSPITCDNSFIRKYQMIYLPKLFTFTELCGLGGSSAVRMTSRATRIPINRQRQQLVTVVIRT